MNLLVIGSGGREHALVWKLAQSPRVTKIWCAPGNAGIAQEQLSLNRSLVECPAIAADDLEGLLAFARDNKVGLTVVGPDNPLALGIVDLFQKNGLRIWGPNQKAAQFESSKAFSQKFMEKHGIPHRHFRDFHRGHEDSAKDFARTRSRGRCAVKADGLAQGKGVFICNNVTEAYLAIDEIMVNQKFGAAGKQVVIQELLEVGWKFRCTPCVTEKPPNFSQPLKTISALRENDAGLNTGGMGTFIPLLHS